MEIVGTWDPHMDCLLARLCSIGDALECGIQALPQGDLRAASEQLYGQISALSTSLYKLCRDTSTRCSAQAVGALLRTAIECSVSVFAFCRDPAARAPMFLKHEVVLRFKQQARCLDKIGCPLLPADRYRAGKVQDARSASRKAVLQFGAAYLRKKPSHGNTTADVLAEATEEGAERLDWFRDRWFPEGSRAEVLAYERMGWIDDVLYKWLCACVHSDITAGWALAGMQRTTAAMLGLQFWGASVLRLAEALGLSLQAADADFLRQKLYAPLQWTPR